MTTEPEAPYVVIDTSVLSYFTARSKHASAYQALLGDRRIALSYFVRAELDGRDWGEKRQERLQLLYRDCVALPPGEATSTWYNRARTKRSELELVSAVGDTDLWIIAHAAEYGVPLMSHDRRAVRIARELGIQVLTALADDD